MHMQRQKGEDGRLTRKERTAGRGASPGPTTTTLTWAGSLTPQATPVAPVRERERENWPIILIAS